MMNTTAKSPDSTPIPVQLSESEFTEFIFPHLSMPKRGPKCKIGSHRFFNLILWVLYTGMQWKCLHSAGFGGRGCHRSAVASRREDVQGEEPVSRWDCSSFHLHATAASMLSAPLVGHEVVQMA